MASSSLEVEDSTSTFLDLPLRAALKAKSIFSSFLDDEELSWGVDVHVHLMSIDLPQDGCWSGG